MTFNIFSKWNTLCSIVLLCIFSSISVFGQISCIESVNVSLNENCEYTLESDDVLTHHNPAGTYTLEIYANGSLVTNNFLDHNYLWTTVTAKVTNSAGNSCWGSINVEDKLGPSIVCTPLEIECYEMEDYLPSATDSCSVNPIEVVVLENEIVNFVCNDVYLKEIIQTYQAKDDFGNTSSCSRSIFLKRFDMSSIVFPPDYRIIDSTNLKCSQLTPEGELDLDITKVPTANGQDIYPVQDSYCNIGISYSDIVVKDGCVKSIMRTWYIADWACNATQDTNHVQVIEVADENPPTITSCLDQLIVDADSGSGCEASVTLSLPEVEDDCFGEFEFDVSYQGGFLNNVTADFTLRLSGRSLVHYTIYDQCDNIARCETLVQVNDGASPVAICDQNSVVSLRSDGTALAHPQTFDDGSYDNCNLETMLIKRMSNSNCACERPSFKDLTFVGSHNGHYYYLSHYGYLGSQAASLADAYSDGDANLAFINDIDEAAWLANALGTITDSIYIGLKYKGTGLPFTYTNHGALTYGEWAPGQVDQNGVPLVPGQYVVLNENGEWEIVSGNTKLPFLLEINSECSFNEVVHFCCADAGLSHQVRLRVVDASGRINECMSTITVQDKIAPVVSCPRNTTFDCSNTHDFTDSNVWGTFTATDQCVVDANNLDINLDNYDAACGSGYVTRTFVVSDASGTTSSCTQVINASNPFAFVKSDIIWPADIDLAACYDALIDPAVSGSPVVPSTPCSNIAISNSNDQRFDFPSGEYQKIIRTWKVTDECHATGSKTYTHQQTIKLNIIGVNPSVVCHPFRTATIQANPSAPNMPLVMVDPNVFIQSVTNDCGADITASFSIQNPTTGVSGSTDLMFTCADVGSSVVVPIYIYADGVLVATHTPTLTIDDANNACSGGGGQAILLTGCEQEIFQFDDCPADGPMIEFNVEPQNICLLPANFIYSVTLDYFNDGTIDLMETGNSSFDYHYFLETLPGNHVADITVIDACGNVGRCIKHFGVDCEQEDDGEIISSGCYDRSEMINCNVDTILLHHSSYLNNSTTCNEAVTVFAEIDLQSDGVIDYVELQSGNLDLILSQAGTHTVHYTSTACNLSSSCSRTISLICQDLDIVLENCGPESGLIDCNNGEEYFVSNYVLPVSNNLPCAPIEIIALVDLNSDGINDLVYQGQEIVDLTLNSVGTHSISYMASDNCGNTASCSKNVVIDCYGGLELLHCENEELVVDCTQDDEFLFPFFAEYLGPECSSKSFTRVIVDLNSDGTEDLVFQEFDMFLEYSISQPGNHSVLLEAFVCGQAESCTKNIIIECEDVATLGGAITTDDGSISLTNCETNLAFQNFVVVAATGQVGDNFAYVLVDSQGVILSINQTGQTVQNLNTVSLPSNLVGTYSLYHIAYSNSIIGLQIGNNLTDLNGIFDLSNSIELVVCEINQDIFSISSCADSLYTIPCNQNVTVPINIAYHHLTCSDPASFTIDIDLNSNGFADQTIIAQGLSLQFPFDLPEGAHEITYTVDACGDVAQCSEILTVNCIDGTMGVVSGKIITEDNLPVPEVLVDLEGSNLQMEGTDAIGEYAFPAMPSGGSYMISPVKDDNYLNGVSTLDLIQMQRHVLGIQKLDSPYKMIAADVDQSGSINGIDLVELRKLILGVYSELPNNTSWRLIDADQDFSAFQTPFVTNIKESYRINSLESDMEVDFVGVKIGDVNNSIEFFNANPIDLRRSNVNISLDELTTGDDTKKYVVKGNENIYVNGFQFSLSVNPDQVDLLEIIPVAEDLDYNNFNLQKFAYGEIIVSWNGSEMNFNQELFHIRMVTDESATDRNLVTISDVLNAEVYADNSIYNLNIAKDTEEVEVITLYQNNPNPWSDYTDIKFKMPKDNEVYLSIYDLNGRLVYQENKVAHKGLNVVRVSKSDINSSGVLYYELLSDDNRYVQKMILLD